MSQQSGKIITDVAAWLQTADRTRQTLVFTNGCFDLLHPGHLHLLQSAGQLGDILVVAVNSDASVRRLKGDRRPVQPLPERLSALAALAEVDAVIAFEEDTPLSLIERIRPDVLVKGGDYKADEVVGNHLAGKTVIIPLLEGYSTTNILNAAEPD